MYHIATLPNNLYKLSFRQIDTDNIDISDISGRLYFLTQLYLVHV